jgi:hypothetical protein
LKTFAGNITPLQKTSATSIGLTPSPSPKERGTINYIEIKKPDISARFL